jgi:predicted nucleic acid-binding protein
LIVADTGAVFALLHTDEKCHVELLGLHREDPDAWVLPWAILPELDYLLQKRGGPGAQPTFLAELADGAWAIEWGSAGDVERARELDTQYAALKLGLVDGVVMAIAERLRADAIATLDVRHFGAVKLAGAPRLLPRDL